MNTPAIIFLGLAIYALYRARREYLFQKRAETKINKHPSTSKIREDNNR